MPSPVNVGLLVETTERTVYTQEVNSSGPLSPPLFLGTKSPVIDGRVGFVCRTCPPDIDCCRYDD
jgi:hypothetical protein